MREQKRVVLHFGRHEKLWEALYAEVARRNQDKLTETTAQEVILEAIELLLTAKNKK